VRNILGFSSSPFRFLGGFSFSIWSCLVRRKKETREKKKTKTSDRYIFLPRESEIRYSFLVLEGRNQFFPKELCANDVQLPAINAV